MTCRVGRRMHPAGDSRGAGWRIVMACKRATASPWRQSAARLRDQARASWGPWVGSRRQTALGHGGGDDGRACWTGGSTDAALALPRKSVDLGGCLWSPRVPGHVTGRDASLGREEPTGGRGREGRNVMGRGVMGRGRGREWWSLHGSRLESFLLGALPAHTSRRPVAGWN